MEEKEMDEVEKLARELHSNMVRELTKEGLLHSPYNCPKHTKMIHEGQAIRLGHCCCHGCNPWLTSFDQLNITMKEYYLNEAKEIIKEIEGESKEKPIGLLTQNEIKDIENTLTNKLKEIKGTSLEEIKKEISSIVSECFENFYNSKKENKDE